MKAYNDAKTDAPKALSDANALFAKAAALGTALSKYNVTLDRAEAGRRERAGEEENGVGRTFRCAERRPWLAHCVKRTTESDVNIAFSQLN